MKIGILGASGMLGSMLSFYCDRQGIPAIRITRSQFDVLKHPIDILDSLFPSDTSAIVNCIGAIPQRRYSTDEFTILNETFPLQLANWCESHGVPLIHISTNCVFSGGKDNYTEKDLPDAEDIYGISKYKGEPKNATVFRCSIIGFETSSAYGLLEWFYKTTSGSVFGFTDSYWNGLTTYELSRRIVEWIEKDVWEQKLVHFRAANTLSKYEILCYIRDNYKPSIVISPKEAGLKYYTLQSVVGAPISGYIENQIDELFSIQTEYRIYCGSNY